jgi:tetraacyldisaccharide 4'-kinase
MNFLQAIAYPFSVVYGTAGLFRNKLFDLNILKQKKFDLPVISVGNLSAGGTGKTPHIEYLIRLLMSRKRELCTLSRGYGRKTKGFFLATDKCSPKEIGDEPCQFVNKFPEIRVAVDESRVNGIKKLLGLSPPAKMILLDDAFQHRYVKPGLSVLLTDYFQPYYKDHVLPSGMLREFRTGANRADIIIVTKCPPVLSPITRKAIIEKIRPQANQHIYFSFLKYGGLVPLYPENSLVITEERKFYAILLLAGIANTYPLEEHLKRSCIELELLKFPDHHTYSKAEILKMRETFCNIVGKNKIIVTTEKDYMRLAQDEFKEVLKGLPIYYQPIEVEFF